MQAIFSSDTLWRLLIGLCASAILIILVVTAQLLGWVSHSGNEPAAVINVPGVAKVLATPDVAVFRFGVEAEDSDVAITQASVSKTISAINDYLTNEGVAKTDIKTSGYNVYPRYRYPDCRVEDCTNKRTLLGYSVSQQVTVKVREFDQAGTLIGGLGERGATNIGGLTFTIDDTEKLRDEARLLAIADAKERAAKIAAELGKRLDEVIGVSDADYSEPDFRFKNSALESAPRAFSLAADSGVAGPEIMGGEQEIISRVTVTYRLK